MVETLHHKTIEFQIAIIGIAKKAKYNILKE